MKSAQIEITSKNGLPEEEQTVENVRELYEAFPIPRFTNRIVIEKGSRPHSHPVLTLNTRLISDKLNLLQTVTHEQLHWFAREQPRYKACIDFLKSKYPDDGERNQSGTHPDSYWEHIIVCFNTRHALMQWLQADEIRHVYRQWQPYPALEKYIETHMETLEEELRRFNMIVTP